MELPLRQEQAQGQQSYLSANNSTTSVPDPKGRHVWILVTVHLSKIPLVSNYRNVTRSGRPPQGWGPFVSKSLNSNLFYAVDEIQQNHQNWCIL